MSASLFDLKQENPRWPVRITGRGRFCRTRRLIVAFSLGFMLQCALGQSSPTTRPSADAVKRKTLVVLGDSLAAGLGVDPTEAYPAVLQRLLDDAGLGYHVVNAGVSGDTSAGALRRVD